MDIDILGEGYGQTLRAVFEYTAFDTQSKLNAKTVPSSAGQLKFARALVNELNELGFEK